MPKTTPATPRREIPTIQSLSARIWAGEEFAPAAMQNTSAVTVARVVLIMAKMGSNNCISVCGLNSRLGFFFSRVVTKFAGEGGLELVTFI